MRAQVTSILLSALLCSTLGHEYLSARQISQRHSQSRHHGSRLSHFQARAQEDQCTIVCEGNKGTLNIVISENLKLIGIVNVTANVAIVIDLDTNLVGLFNGNTGAALIVNIEAKTGVYIAAKVWISSSKSFEVFLNGLTSLKVLLYIAGAVKFTIETASEVVIKVAAEILVNFGATIAAQIKASPKASLQIILTISVALIGVLKGSVSVLLERLRATVIRVEGDLTAIVNKLLGLVKLLGKVEGGVAALIKAGIVLKLEIILGLANGIEVLAHILGQIGEHLDLSKVLAGVINNVEELLSIIVLFGGGIAGGIDGLIKVVFHIVLVIRGKLSLTTLINTLIKYSVEANVGIDIKIAIGVLLKVTKQQEIRFKNSAALKVFVELLQNIIEGKLVIGGVNISAIIEVLVKGALSGALSLVVNILVLLKAVVAINIAIPQLYLHLLGFLNEALGVDLLIRLLPELSSHLALGINAQVNILATIFKKVNILALFKGGFNLENVLKNLPVVGQIHVAISKAVEVHVGGSVTLIGLLSAGGTVLIQIKAWIAGALNIKQTWILRLLGVSQGSININIGVIGVAVGDGSESGGGSGTGSGSGYGSGGLSGSGSGSGNGEVSGDGSGSGSGSGGSSETASEGGKAGITGDSGISIGGLSTGGGSGSGKGTGSESGIGGVTGSSGGSVSGSGSGNGGGSGSAGGTVAVSFGGNGKDGFNIGGGGKSSWDGSIDFGSRKHPHKKSEEQRHHAHLEHRVHAN